MGRRQRPIEFFKEQLALYGDTMPASKKSRFTRIVRGLCIGCGELPKPGFRRCEVCALDNIERVMKSNRRKGER